MGKFFKISEEYPIDVESIPGPIIVTKRVVENIPILGKNWAKQITKTKGVGAFIERILPFGSSGRHFSAPPTEVIKETPGNEGFIQRLLPGGKTGFQVHEVEKNGQFFKTAGPTKLITKKVKKDVLPKAFGWLKSKLPSSATSKLVAAENVLGLVLAPGEAYADAKNWKTTPNVVDDWVIPWPFESAPWTAQIVKDLKRNDAIIGGYPYVKYDDGQGLHKPTESVRTGNKLPDTGVSQKEYDEWISDPVNKKQADDWWKLAK